MKYLMLDTNIYIDMVVARNKSHKADSYHQLKKLLDYGEIKLIVPKIVITEVYRHIENEITKVGLSISEIKKRTNDLYWINHSEELKKFNKILNPVKSSINKLVDEFDRSSEAYKNDYRILFNKLYSNDNCFVIEENDDIVFKAIQRSIYKKRPFHYEGKDNDKDSMADAIIIETLINIKNLININNEDFIYFISRNPVDFSVDNKQNKDVLHEDFLSSIKENKMNNIIKYSTLFTNTLLQEFKDEIETVGLTEELEFEAEYERRLELQESYELQSDSERESAGLSSLSTDYEEVISRSDEIVKLMELIEEIKEEICTKCEEYCDKYYNLCDLLENKDFEELNLLIDNSLLRFFLGASSDEDEIKESIKNLIEVKIGEEDYADFGKEIKTEYRFSNNDTLFTFSDGLKNEYKLISSGFLDPRDNDTDTIYLNLYMNDRIIQESEINIYYGYITFNDDGNVDDGAEEDFSANIDELFTELVNIKENILLDLENKIDKFQNLIDILN